MLSFFFNFKAKQALLFDLNMKKTCICYVISLFNRIYNESFEPRKTYCLLLTSFRISNRMFVDVILLNVFLDLIL